MDLFKNVWARSLTLIVSWVFLFSSSAIAAPFDPWGGFANESDPFAMEEEYDEFLQSALDRLAGWEVTYESLTRDLSGEPNLTPERMDLVNTTQQMDGILKKLRSWLLVYETLAADERSRAREEIEQLFDRLDRLHEKRV